MKRILTIASVLISTVMFAGGMELNPSSVSGVALVRRDQSTVKVYFKSERVADVKVSIFNSSDKLVFHETVKKTAGFVRPYNLGNLPIDAYSIVVTDDSGSELQRTLFYTGKVAKLVRVVKLSSQQGKYLLTASGNGKEQITVNIYDATEKLIFNQSRTIAGNHAELYNLSKVKGHLTFEIVHENGTVHTMKY